MPRWPTNDLAWKPTPRQLYVLTLAAQDPQAATNKADLAKKAGIGLATLYRWHADPCFRQWWSEQLCELAQTFRGPAMLELMAIIENPRIRSDRKTKAIEVLLSQVGGISPHKAAAVLALMQAFQGSPPGAELHLASGKDQNGNAAIAGMVRKPDPEVLEVERQGEELGALRASVSVERVAARVSAQLAQPEAPISRTAAANEQRPRRVDAILQRLGLRSTSQPTDPDRPSAPHWKSQPHLGTAEPARPPADVPTTVRHDAPREGERAGVGTDSEPSPLRAVRTPLLNDHG